MFYNNKVDKTPGIKIQKVVIYNVFDLPKTLFTLITISKKSHHI